jgi:hypothetical protein
MPMRDSNKTPLNRIGRRKEVISVYWSRHVDAERIRSCWSGIGERAAEWRNWDERWEAANKKEAVISPEDPEAPTTTPKSTPTSTPRRRWNRNNKGSVNTSTRQHVNMSSVNTATCQHGECSAGGGEAQKLAWEVWALGGVVSDGCAPPGARHRGC